MANKTTNYDDEFATNYDDEFATKKHQSKEKRVVYATKVLNKYGNAFISEDIKQLWRNDDLGGYLSSTTGRPVKIRKCRQMENGCVAEIDYKAERKTQ